MAIEGRPEGLHRDIPRDEREYIIVQCFEFTALTEKTPYRFRKTGGQWLARRPVRYAKLTDFDTRDKVANYVHTYFGHGTYNVFVRANFISSKFRPTFKCTKKIEARCPYFQKGTCKIWRKTPDWICRNNRKHVFAWKHVARVKLNPYDEPFSEKEFTYEWFPEKDKIKNFWWWHDTGARNRTKPKPIRLEE